MIILSQGAILQAFSLLTYNVAGNGTTDWSTNAPQVQAIGRQMIFLQPDVITFNEIPFTNTFQMVHFVEAFLPGYFLATNSGTDGFLRSVIVSRFPIRRSQKWLDGVSLTNFGYSGRFSRDLFEAEIVLPNFPDPLHVFTTHLKSLSDAESASRRGAEASAISNFFVSAFLPSKGQRTYVLTGDLNEDINRPPSTSHQPVQRVANRATGLELTTPLNPFSGSDKTISIRGTLDRRFDYILPCQLLRSNIAGAEVFRTDLLEPTPSTLQKFDDKTASDHLPVLVWFNNPYEVPFRVVAAALKQQKVTLEWQAIRNRVYAVQNSDDLVRWTAVATNLIADSANQRWTADATNELLFFRIQRLP